MKRFTLLLFFSGIIMTGTSQIKKGQWLVGGNISFESMQSEGWSAADYKTSTVSISPNLGYFIIDKLAGGLRSDLRWFKQTAQSDSRQKYTSVSPFLRYYLLPSTKKVNAFIEAGYLNYRSRFKFPPSTDYIRKSSGYNISAGPVIFLTEQVALEFVLGYRRVVVKNAPAGKESRFNTGLGLQIHLGKIKRKEK